MDCLARSSPKGVAPRRTGDEKLDEGGGSVAHPLRRGSRAADGTTLYRPAVARVMAR